MKKLFISVFTLLLALCLVACNADNTPKDEVEPEISGVKTTLTATVNQEINLLAGVTATDDVDGNITDKIEVTTLPELPVNNGKVTVANPGDYEIQYSVKDAAGNEGAAFSTLTVTPALAEKVEYKKLTYEAGAVEGWNTYFNEAAEGSGSVVKGRYQINVTKGSGEMWHVKYETTLETEVGADYEIRYTIVGSVNGPVVAGSWTDIEAGKVTTVSKKFTAGNATEYVCLELGQLGPKIQLSL